MKPQQYDVLGVLTFTYITGFAAYMLQSGEQNVPQWAVYILLFLGVAGFLIDAGIVYKYFGPKPKRDKLKR